MKTFDEILSNANIQRIDGDLVMMGDGNTCILEVLRGMYDEIRKKIDDPF